MIKPLNNHCLIEVLDEYEGVIRDKTDENVQKGKLLSFNACNMHLTASAGLHVPVDVMSELAKSYSPFIGKTVYWQEYADAGSKFTIDGKKYVLVPFYRLIGVEE